MPIDQLLALFAAMTGESLFALDMQGLAAHAMAATRDAPAAQAPKAVAIIGVYGGLSARTQSSWFGSRPGMDALRSRLKSAASNPDIGTIVLDMDTPGGTVAGTPETAAAVRDAATQKPVIAVVDTLAASAGYWIGSQASELVMTPSARVGSIGVFSLHEDYSARAAQLGIRHTFVSSSPEKIEGNPYEPLSEAARAEMQARVDDAHAAFMNDVAIGRRVPAAKVAADFGRGRTIEAGRAVQLGMADRVATMHEVLAGIAAGPSPARPRAARRSAIAFL